MTNSESIEKRHNSSSSTHRRTQSSTTLNRKYVRRPGSVRQSVAAESAISHNITSTAKRQTSDLKRRQAIAEKLNRERLNSLAKKTAAKTTSATPKIMRRDTSPIAPATMHPLQKKLADRNNQTTKEKNMSMSDKKNAAIKSALNSVATMESKMKRQPIVSHIKAKRTFSAKKIILAFSCAAISIAAIGYFISLNMPDVSVRVAAMQTGIEATYPTYIPRGYKLSNISSENKKLTINFTDGENHNFSITEERSSWDSYALESNYAKKTWDSNYSAIREQGLTIFVSNSDAAWVNGGIVYKLTTTNCNLTKKQIKSIATSL